MRCLPNQVERTLFGWQLVCHPPEFFSSKIRSWEFVSFDFQSEYWIITIAPFVLHSLSFSICLWVALVCPAPPLGAPAGQRRSSSVCHACQFDMLIRYWFFQLSNLFHFARQFGVLFMPPNPDSLTVHRDSPPFDFRLGRDEPYRSSPLQIH